MQKRVMHDYQAVELKQKHDFKRPRNREETSSFLCNFFYCFFCPFVCRRSPLIHKDLPDLAQLDTAEVATDPLRTVWNQSYANYHQQRAAYDRTLVGFAILFLSLQILDHFAVYPRNHLH